MAPVHPRVLLAVMAGGAFGALARYQLAQALPVSANAFPWATFWTNLSGAFVLAVFMTIALERRPRASALAPFLAVGVLGAYTTFSTLAVETATLVKDGHAPLGIGYLLASVGAGLALTYLGIQVGRRVPRAAKP